jgi:HSP20 family protein
MARITLERRDSYVDTRRRFGWLDGTFASGERTAGETVPPIDVLDTDAGVEIIVDVPGVDVSSVAVMFRDNTVLVSGVKRPAHCRHGQAAFHLAERGFGRFARAVKLSGAFDTGAATATLASGELRIILPRREERRGQEIRIPVEGR